jgi:hypothetical protein
MLGTLAQKLRNVHHFDKPSYNSLSSVHKINCQNFNFILPIYRADIDPLWTHLYRHMLGAYGVEATSAGAQGLGLLRSHLKDRPIQSPLRTSERYWGPTYSPDSHVVFRGEDYMFLGVLWAVTLHHQNQMKNASRRRTRTTYKSCLCSIAYQYNLFVFFQSQQ